MAADLISLQEVKAYAGINSANQDLAISNLIPMVSQFVKTYCNRTFIDKYESAQVEVKNGGTPYFYLSEHPIVELVSVERSTDFGQTYTALTEYTDYILDGENDRVTCLSSSFGSTDNVPPLLATNLNTLPTGGEPVFSKLPNGYKITYRGGFAEIPADLKLAVMDLILYYMKNDMAVKSPRSAGSNTAAIEYITNANLPAHIRRVLDNYRMVE